MIDGLFVAAAIQIIHTLQFLFLCSLLFVALPSYASK